MPGLFCATRRFVGVAVLAFAGVASSGHAAVVAGPAYQHQSTKLNALFAGGSTIAILAVAAQEGKHEEVAEWVRHVGGRVDYMHEPTGYMAVVLPISGVEAFLGKAPISAFAVENTGMAVMGLSAKPPGHLLPRPDPERVPSPVGNVRTGWPPVEGEAPVEYPYDVRRDMDGDGFIDRHAGNDGRGVVIALVENFPDFLISELQTALDENGAEVAKFRDIINVPSVFPSLEHYGQRAGFLWSSKLQAPCEAVDGVIQCDGRVRRVPGDGWYRLATLELPADRVWAIRPVLERVLGGKADRSNPAADEAGDIVVELLWSETHGRLWIDDDMDGHFDTEAGVREYASSGDMGVLGVDDPATPLRESIGYAVQKDVDYVAVNFGYGSHVSAVSGAVAARKGQAGRIEGVAPGAQLIAIYAQEGVAGFVRAMITAYEHPDSDVVLLEGHSRITAKWELGLDGGSLIATILGRIQKLHDKPSFFTAGNTPGVSTIFDATVPQGVLSVGAYQSADAVYSNYGLHVRYQDDLHWVGSEGPAGNGALKPDLLAPANLTTVTPKVSDRPDDGKREGIFRMHGYGICGGTSCATPVAAGAAALLVGAAKREGLPVGGAAIHRALLDSARMIDRFPIYKQGRGLIQIDAAWRRLHEISAEVPEHIQVSAPVNTLMSPWLPEPNTGLGIFEREGWVAGQVERRTVFLKRTGGPEGVLTYQVHWRGDVQAFASSDRVDLPLGQSVPFDVQVSVGRERDYSGLIELRRSGLAGPAAVVPVNIMVPHRFTRSNGYVVESAFELDRPGRLNLFFDVPADTGLLRVHWTKGREGIFGYWHSPDNWQAAAVFRFEERVNTLPRPMPGSWQMTLHDKGDVSRHDWSVPGGGCSLEPTWR